MGVETGGCPHTAIREDASINLEAIDRMLEKFPNADVVFIESGGDNLAATFSPELSDLTIYVIDASSRMAVCGQPPVSTPMMRSARRAPLTVSRRWSSLV